MRGQVCHKAAATDHGVDESKAFKFLPGFLDGDDADMQFFRAVRIGGSIGADQAHPGWSARWPGRRSVDRWACRMCLKLKYSSKIDFFKPLYRGVSRHVAEQEKQGNSNPQNDELRWEMIHTIQYFCRGNQQNGSFDYRSV